LDFAALRFWASARKVEFRSQDPAMINSDEVKKEK
jgi:hypothetical protein